MPSSVVAAITWPFNQLRAFLGNLRAAIGGTSILDVLPPSVVSTLVWLRKQVPRAAGYGTPQEQIVGSTVVAVTMVVASFTVLTPLALVMIIPAAIGFARLFPAVESRWPLRGGGPR